MITARLDFRRLKRTVAIESVLADQGWIDQLRRSGAQLVGPCPIHRGDNQNAFIVNKTKNIWRCFTACDAGGDVIDLARRLQAGSYKAAAHYLADLADAAITARSSQPHPKHPFRPFTSQLFLDADTPFLKRKAIRVQTARRFQVGAFHGSGMMAGCVAVRLFDPQGRPLGYGGRRLDPEMVTRYGKWKFPRGLPRNTLLYGYHHLDRSLRTAIVLVEGPWGVLRLQQLGIPAVALLGRHLSTAQQELLQDLPKVVILMDGDKAGRDAAATIRQRLPRTTVIDLPDGLDPDDLSDQELAMVQASL